MMRLLIGWLSRLFESETVRCARENQNDGLPVRYPEDGWSRRPDGSLVMGGCIRPVTRAPVASPPLKPLR